MDLAVGARRLIRGRPKIVPEVTLPLTGRNVVDVIITDLAVFGFQKGRLALTELMPGATLEQVREFTGAPFAEALS